MCVHCCSLHVYFSNGAACLFFPLSLLFDVKSIIVSQLEFEKKRKISLELGSVSNIHTSLPKTGRTERLADIFTKKPPKKQKNNQKPSNKSTVVDQTKGPCWRAARK